MNTIAAVGHLAKNWPALGCETPAVIVNPAASPMDVLAWCWGEVENLREVADAFEAGASGINGDALLDVFSHRLAPLSKIMAEVVQALIEAQSQGAASRVKEGAV